MVERVLFVSRSVAENTSGKGDWAVISISEPDSALGDAKLMAGWHAIHRTNFHDVDPMYPCGEPHVLMNRDHAADIVMFVESVAPHVHTILVHCRAGVSRSAAVAKWIAKHYGLPFNHQYSLYNKHVYRLLREASGMDPRQDGARHEQEQ